MDELGGEGRPDNMFWEARQISLDKWKDRGCDLAMKIRRPRRKDAGSAARNVHITAYNSFDEGKIVGLGSDKYYLKFDAGLRVAERRVAASYRELEDDDLWVPSGDPNEEAMHLYKRDFHSGAGFKTLLNPSV